MVDPPNDPLQVLPGPEAPAAIQVGYPLHACAGACALLVHYHVCARYI